MNNWKRGIGVVLLIIFAPIGSWKVWTRYSNRFFIWAKWHSNIRSMLLSPLVRNVFSTRIKIKFTN